MKQAMRVSLPLASVARNRPWISQRTLHMIESRNSLRIRGDHAAEKEMNQNIRRSARTDRKAWLLDNLRTGTWDSIRRLRSGFQPKRGRMQDSAGAAVSTEQRANTLASYYATTQWQVRFAELVPIQTGQLGPHLPVALTPFRQEELCKVLRKLNKGKAGGIDDVPTDLWRAMLMNEDAMTILLDLCQRCWEQKEIPEQWRTARAVALFKKGDDAIPENYRPISLLSVGYKILASLLLQRLQDAGSEERIRETQYGFRPERGTADALFLARRLIDAAIERRGGKLLLLMLDWRKAFDRIKPEALIVALRRFGVPTEFSDMIQAIYRVRYFTVREAGCDSDVQLQKAGIAQGCPLSPYLFIIVMTLLLHDVDEQMAQTLQNAPSAPFLVTRDILSADDTLLAAVDVPTLQAHLKCVATVGRTYGLELHWGKTEVIRVRHDGVILAEDGSPLKTRAQVVYLGGLLSAASDPKQEVCRRIGEARSSFNALSKVWSHANLPRTAKIKIYEACVISKLLYGLGSLWLRKAGRSHLDSFHVYCLRRILRIPPSLVSRISNDSVMESAGARPLSEAVLRQQLLLYGKICRMPSTSLVRSISIEPGSPLARTWSGRRRRGRPRQTWNACIRHHALRAAWAQGRTLDELVAQVPIWVNAVSTYVRTV